MYIKIHLTYLNNNLNNNNIIYICCRNYIIYMCL